MQRPLTHRVSAWPHCASDAHGRGSQQPAGPHTSPVPQDVAVQGVTQAHPHAMTPPSSQAGALPQAG